MGSQVEKSERIENIKAMLLRDPKGEGRRLLDLAETNNFKIILRDDFAYLGHIHFSKKIITLNSRHNDKKLVNVLAHELYHLDQLHQSYAMFEGSHLSKNEALLVTRLREGEANARAALLVKSINDTTDLDLPNKYYRLPFLGWHGVKNWLLGKKSSDEHVLETIFTNYQKSINSWLFYDDMIYKNSDHNPSDEWEKTAMKPEAAKMIAAGGLHGKFNYLSAKNVDDFCAKLKSFVPKRYRGPSL